MAELTISLRRDPQSGKQDVVIQLSGDADALPHEHEQMHRSLVEKIVGKGNVGKIIVEREPTAQPTTPVGEEPERERQAVAGQH